MNTILIVFRVSRIVTVQEMAMMMPMNLEETMLLLFSLVATMMMVLIVVVMGDDYGGRDA